MKRRKLALWKARAKSAVGCDGCVHRAIGNARCDLGATDRAKKPTLERFHVGRIHANHVGNAAGQNVTENSEAGAQDGFGIELPCDCGARLKNRKRRRRKYIAEAGLNRGVERLIHVVRDGIE